MESQALPGPDWSPNPDPAAFLLLLYWFRWAPHDDHHHRAPCVVSLHCLVSHSPLSHPLPVSPSLHRPGLGAWVGGPSAGGQHQLHPCRHPGYSVGKPHISGG